MTPKQALPDSLRKQTSVILTSKCAQETISIIIINSLLKYYQSKFQGALVSKVNVALDLDAL